MQINFISVLRPLFLMYINYRKASGKWCSTYTTGLLNLDAFYYNRYPLLLTLEQEPIEEWAKQRETEIASSTNKRIAIINGFISYCNNHNFSKLNTLTYLKTLPCTYIPHAFTLDEMKKFFKACDEYQPKNPNTIRSKNRMLTIPIIYRLLYSSGIRTCEARMLLTKNVNLKDGILNIINSKGPHQHFVALHENMTQLMIKYNVAISELYPNRNFFFPEDCTKCLSSACLSNTFVKIWLNCGFKKIRLYDLRHNYAIININKWISEQNFNLKFYYLSKSMGHTSLESTQYYYSFVPRLAQIIQETEEETFNEIVPEVKYEI